jgi:L-asparagine oxygenase
MNNDKVNKNLRGPIAILYGETNDPRMVYDQDLMVGVNEEANLLKQKITDIYYKYRLKLNLEAGDILFIDNNRVVHGRSSFQPKYNGLDRFLIRCFGLYHFQSTEYAREKNGRMILSKYS